ncbi:unnamed protein product [Phaedon cochleariae]|uniref:Uncharacterized protein n=1 Tax=Phaedon cochleariae TaxID=80249 RepID=A0A9N9X2Y7_PHACE|nr:unnamed protein product [Phaedon cochleariae]
MKISAATNNDSASRRDASKGQCVWYGECNLTPVSNTKQNCPYNGPPKPLNGTGIEILKRRCPDIDPASTCCDSDQLHTLEKNLELPDTMLGRCPSCMANFLRHICHMTCSPNQAEFMKVNSTTVNPKTNKTYISELDVYISNEYITGTFNSCIQVSVPSTGRKALDLMCGDWGASRCTPLRCKAKELSEAQLKSIAGTDHEVNKLRRGIITSNRGNFGPNNARLSDNTKEECKYCGYRHQSDPQQCPARGATCKFCGKTGHFARANTPACNCVDCEDSCPAPPPQPPPPQPFKLAGYDGYAFLMVVVFVVGSVMFLVMVTACSRRTDDLGVKMHNYERELFQTEPENRAEDCQEFVITTVQYKIFNRKIVTDPVELWASPTSRSRVEKEYFDSHFEPFYRTEMVIIRAVNLSYIHHNTSDGIITFGPAFNDTFLKSVRELQEKIKAVGEGTPYSFDKICFAPLRKEDQSDTSVEECVVQSIWGYYQDDVDNFDETGFDPLHYPTNYLDKFIKCARSSQLIFVFVCGAVCGAYPIIIAYWSVNTVNSHSQNDMAADKKQCS